MIENRDIQQGAVTLTKLSKNLRLPLANVEAGTAGQVPVVQSNGDLAYKAIGGDATLDADGSLAVTLAATTTDTIPEGSSNLYYTDARVDARIRQIKHEADQQATNEEPGFMPKEDKAKLDATPSVASTVRKFEVTIAWGDDASNVSFSGSGDSAVGTIRHPLDTKAIVVSIQDAAGRWQDIEYDPFTVTVSSSSQIQIGIEDASSAPSASTEFLVTIIG